MNANNITYTTATRSIFSRKSQNFPITPVFLPPPAKKGFPFELGTGAGDKNANDGAIGPKRSLTIASTYVTDRRMDRQTDKWTRDDSKDRAYA